MASVIALLVAAAGAVAALRWYFRGGNPTATYDEAERNKITQMLARRPRDSGSR